MDKPLSFSGYKRFMMCPRLYKYHDIEKYRPGKDTSALLFGSIMDTIISRVLQCEDFDPYEALSKMVADVELTDIDFYPEDYDKDLICLVDAKNLAQDMGWKGNDIDSAIKDMLKNQEELSSKQRLFLNKVVWLSLEEKGQCMIDSVAKWILPQIKSVHSLQRHVKSKDGDIHGYLDFIAIMEDGREVLIDLKTSKMPYKKDVVDTAAQIILYSALTDYKYAGFLILSKTLKKNKHKTCSCGYETTGGNRRKCPDCGNELAFTIKPTSYSQLLIEEIPQHKKDLTVEALQDTIKCIDGGNFPRNLNQCDFMYGRPCPYKAKCWETK